VSTACKSYIYFGRENIVHAKEEDGEKIKVRHDESNKVLYKPRIVIVCIK
jgi:hypothetical protein